jgi:hypothetical protein
MLKLFAVELAVLVAAFYIISVMVLERGIPMKVGLALFAVVLIVEHIVDWHLIEYDEFDIKRQMEKHFR